MKKDISFLPVEGVKVAVAREKLPSGEYEWRVFLLNRNDVALTNVFVTSKGYGAQQDSEKPLSGTESETPEETEPQKTSVLRHFFTRIEPQTFSLIEPIDPSVFHLYSEYWVSYYIGSQIYDKKFIFVPESITEENLIPIALLGLDGVLHD